MLVTILMAGVNNRMKSGESPCATLRLPIFWALAAIVPVPKNRTARLSYFMRSMPETAPVRKGHMSKY